MDEWFQCGGVSPLPSMKQETKTSSTSCLVIENLLYVSIKQGSLGTLLNSLNPQLPTAGQNPAFIMTLGGKAFHKG